MKITPVFVGGWDRWLLKGCGGDEFVLVLDLGENTPSHIGAAAGGCCKLFKGPMDGCRGEMFLWILRIANAPPSVPPNPNPLI
jgi:hypothetical protein